MPNSFIKMQQQLIVTADGSHTIFIPQLNENYHSTRGAINESMHVFINAGFNAIQKENISILEIGFGTGLNCWLTLNQTICQHKQVYYEAIEAYPLSPDVWQSLNYPSLINQHQAYNFKCLHVADWNKEIEINNLFTLKKVDAFLTDYTPQQNFDLIYFDAFAPDIQPEMWTKGVFDKMWNALNVSGILVTYSSKGIVKQNLRHAKFTVNRLKGACGKRHMLQAVKY